MHNIARCFMVRNVHVVRVKNFQRRRSADLFLALHVMVGIDEAE